MAASWCLARSWYSKTGHKLYKTHKKLIKSQQTILHRSFFSSSAVLQKDNFQKIAYDVATKKGEKKDTTIPLPAAYSPQFVEAAWYDWWVEQGFFQFPASPGEGKGQGRSGRSEDGERFVVLLPPPNVTGTLHLGHALTAAIQDTLVRWQRMKGVPTLWVPGTDHAGIATQAVVERSLMATRGQTRQQLGRQQFQDLVWQWRQQKGGIIEEQMKSLGSSLDWSRNFFTLDEPLSGAVREAFVLLWERGKLYRQTQLVNWSCSLQSSISDIEVDMVSVEGRTKRPVPGYKDGVEFGVLASFAYPVDDSGEEIVVSTTRLETMLGDVAIAVHPDDPRYGALIGRNVRHPLCDRLLPIIADPFVDRDFGSGAVKVTPGHDPVDLEVGRRHGLPELSILDNEGRMCGDVPPWLRDMPRFRARQAVRAALEERGLYRGERDHPMALPVCSRSGDVIEPRLKEQWFLNCTDMVRRAIEAAQTGQLTFSSPGHQALWLDWLGKGRDWCLSRQLWWGHRIPAYCFQTEEGPVWLAARTEEEAVQRFTQQYPGRSYQSITQDEDVLDTWFSSALLPFSVFGWPQQTKDLGELYPLSLMETGQDILFFWVARMVMLGLELTDTLPFTQVMLHGTVRDAQGRKMSKSLGNVIDPLDVIHGATLKDLQDRLEASRLGRDEMRRAVEAQQRDFPHGVPECGTDALRFALCSYDCTGDAVPLDVLHVRTYRLFCNKVWQSFRFTLQHLHHFTPLEEYRLSGSEEAIDLWLLSRLSGMVHEVDAALSDRSLHSATRALYTFWVNQFCDVYLECCKPVFQHEGPERQAAVQQLLYHATFTFLRALAPFMPFLTEELFQRLPPKGDHWPRSICIAPYPRPEEFLWQDACVEREMDQVLDICHSVLNIRHEYNVTKHCLPVDVVVDSVDQLSAMARYTKVMSKLCKADPITINTATTTATAPSGCVTNTLTSCQLHVQLQGFVDFGREIKRLTQKRDKIAEKQQSVASKLADLVQKGKGHLPVAQKLKVKEQSLASQLEAVSTSLEDVLRIQGRQ